MDRTPQPAPQPASLAGTDAIMRGLMSLSREALAHSKVTRHLVVRQMRLYAERIGVDLAAASVVHVAGTKGKGSTCAMVESVLRAHGYRTGLFTSPHLVHLRERFRIDGRPAPEGVFVEHMYATYADLRAAHLADPDGAAAAAAGGPPLPPMPSYFRFLTLVALRMFAAAGVDVVVLETGLGGKLDATNAIERPVACGISRIDYDHVAVLGGTLDLIAREKGGILKPGVPSFTIAQAPEAARALQECADAAGTPLVAVPPLPAAVPLGLEGDHQRANAALAAALAHAWLVAQGTDGVPARLDPARLSPRFLAGLARCEWPGRCQRVASRVAPALTWHLDGAHTADSIAACLGWFRGRSGSAKTHRVLVFNCGHDRDPFALLGPLAGSGVFHSFLTCPFDADRPRLDGPPKLSALVAEADGGAAAAGFAPKGGTLPPDSDSWQGTVAQVWGLLEEKCGAAPAPVATGAPPSQCCVLPSTASVVHTVEQLSRQHPGVRVDALVTGSLYTVGNVLAALGAEL